VDIIVPRDRHAEFVQQIVKGKVTFGAEVGAAFYYVAVSTALVVVLCLACLGYCIQWLAQTYSSFSPERKKWTIAGIVAAIALPLAVLSVQLKFAPGCDRIGIDDCVTNALLEATITRQELHHQKFFSMRNDSNILSCIVFVTYLIATLTIAVAASSLPPDPKQPPSNAPEIGQRISLLNTILLLTSAVLVSGLITAKFRFDVGLATLVVESVDKPGASIAAYKTIASAITAYWATVLSMWLALMYLPGSALLNGYIGQDGKPDMTKMFELTRENGIRLIKLAAILSPPLVNKLIEVFATKAA
jgi:hypothetical protein